MSATSPHPTSRAGASFATLLGALCLAGCAVPDGARRTQTLPSLSLLAATTPQDPQNPQDPPDVPQAPQVPEQDEPRQEESEVLEERRRGADEAPDEEAEDDGFSWWFGPRFDAFAGELVLVAGGRVHLDGAVFDEDEAINEEFGKPKDGGEVRRAFLEIGGVYRSLDFNFWLNFSELRCCLVIL